MSAQLLDLIVESKFLADKRGVPYQVLMRLLIADGVRRLKSSRGVTAFIEKRTAASIPAPP